MKPRHIVIINLVFVGLMLFSAGVVVQFMTGRKPLNLVTSLAAEEKPVKVATNICNSRPSLQKLSEAKATSLRKLQTYQQACHSFVTDTVMVFIGMPTSEGSAKAEAAQTAATLKEFASYGIRPLVIVEPTDYATSVNIDFATFASGKYQPALDSYFRQLKAAGVTDSQMGIWNPFPEANLPYWENNQPEYFAPNVNMYIASMHRIFPAAKTSIMLNSATYETTDFNWENGDYASWLPYIKDVKPGSIDYVGMQGFPWSSAKGGRGLIINAAEFLNPDVLTEGADHLKVKNVWFNTGTFGTKYALDPERRVEFSPEQRKAIFGTVEEQVAELQDKGYTVAVNIFAEDKSKVKEETDWSYWSGGDPFSSPATPVFTQFVQTMSDKKAAVWLFDK